MTNLTSRDLMLAAERCAVAAVDLEQELNRLDAQLGDGDTGTMLLRLALAVRDVDHAKLRPGQMLGEMANAAANSTGSSLGTLIASALLAMSSCCGDRMTIPVAELSPLLRAGSSEMLFLGRSQLGNKTVIDSIDAIAVAVEASASFKEAARAADLAAEKALRRFRGRPCMVGRARLYPEKSMGLDDPGMVAVAAMTKAIACDAAA